MPTRRPPPYELTEAGLRQFAEAGVAKHERDRWLNAGFGPYAALNHIRINVSVDDAYLARSVGLSSNDLAPGLKRGESVAEQVTSWQARVGLDPDDLIRLRKRGFSVEAVDAAVQSSVPLALLAEYSPDQIERLSLLFVLGLDAAEAIRRTLSGLDLRPFSAMYRKGHVQLEGDPRQRFRALFEDLRDHVGVKSDELLALLAAGLVPQDIVLAGSAGATVDLLLHVAEAADGAPRISLHDLVVDLVEVLDNGVAGDVLFGWLAHGLDLRKIRGALRKGTAFDNVPWIVGFTRSVERRAWQRTTDSVELALQWRRYGLGPNEIENGSPSAVAVAQIALVDRITAVKLDSDSDYPCKYQGEAAHAGVIDVRYYHLTETGYLTGEISTLKMGLAELLEKAVESGVQFLQIDGLDHHQALQLLRARAFLPLVAKLVQRQTEHEQDEPWIDVNGAEVTVESGELVWYSPEQDQ